MRSIRSMCLVLLPLFACSQPPDAPDARTDASDALDAQAADASDALDAQAADASDALDAQADAATSVCWDGASIPPVEAGCRSDAALRTSACRDAYVPLAAPGADALRAAVERATGKRLDDSTLLTEHLGFFVAEGGVFVSAIHAWEGCLQAGPVRGEYLAGRDGPALPCGLAELLYVGSGARYVTPVPLPVDWECPGSCPPPSSPTSSCFDCQPLESNGDIVVGRLLDRATHPDRSAIVTIADAQPDVGAPIAALGKPRIEGVVPHDERRVSAGVFLGGSGSGVRTSAYLTTGFSGGPMLDACGRAFAVSVSRVDDLRVRDPSWDLTESVGVSLVALRDRVTSAIAYAASNPLP